jgi:hypothetical protein
MKAKKNQGFMWNIVKLDFSKNAICFCQKTGFSLCESDFRFEGLIFFSFCARMEAGSGSLSKEDFIWKRKRSAVLLPPSEKRTA